MASDLRQKLRLMVAKARLRVRRHVPPGFRWPVGFALIVGGLFGFLPILGFWMIPLGVAVAAMDLGPLWRRMRGR